MIPISRPFIGPEEKRAVLEVLDSGMLVQGSRTARLEEKFAAVCGTKHAIATSSGTTALHLALLAHGIGQGDEVITTPFTFMASVNCILYVGAKPVFVDVEEDTFNLNPALVEPAITPRTRAILPVHLFGYPCDMEAICAVADRHGLAVIEDACQAVGATFSGQPVGSFGTGCFSLYATKNIMAGEGGIITTNDDIIEQRCRMLRNHGMQRRYYHDLLGYNFRISDLHAAIALAQIERLNEFTERRRINATYLSAHISSVAVPKARPGFGVVWHQFTVRVDKGRDRDSAVKQLNDAGIGTGIFYPVPAYRQAYLLEMGYGDLSLPVTERLVHEVVSLPVHPQLNQADLEAIVAEVNKL
jgi:perosamine synthetase